MLCLCRYQTPKEYRPDAERRQVAVLQVLSLITVLHIPAI